MVERPVTDSRIAAVSLAKVPKEVQRSFRLGRRSIPAVAAVQNKSLRMDRCFEWQRLVNLKILVAERPAV